LFLYIIKLEQKKNKIQNNREPVTKMIIKLMSDRTDTDYTDIENSVKRGSNINHFAVLFLRNFEFKLNKLTALNLFLYQ